MNERNIIAAILAVGVTQAQQQTGTSWPKAAEQAVSIYQLILAELAKKQLPPAVGAHAGNDSASASTSVGTARFSKFSNR
jgi:hypothetical protein